MTEPVAESDAAQIVPAGAWTTLPAFGIILSGEG